MSRGCLTSTSVTRWTEPSSGGRKAKRVEVGCLVRSTWASVSTTSTVPTSSGTARAAYRSAMRRGPIPSRTWPSRFARQHVAVRHRCEEGRLRARRAAGAVAGRHGVDLGDRVSTHRAAGPRVRHRARGDARRERCRRHCCPASPCGSTPSSGSSAMWPPAALEFLRDLEDNNDRDWFKANRARYDDHLRAPGQALADALSEFGTARFFRPYNDARFHHRPPIKEQLGHRHRLRRGGRLLRRAVARRPAHRRRPPPSVHRSARAISRRDRRRPARRRLRARAEDRRVRGPAARRARAQARSRAATRSTTRASSGCA